MDFSYLKICPPITSKRISRNDDSNQSAKIITVGDEIFGESFEAGGIFLVKRNAVDRINQRLTKQNRPDPVDDCPGELFVFRVGQPFGQFLIRVRVADEGVIVRYHNAMPYPLVIDYLRVNLGAIAQIQRVIIVGYRYVVICIPDR